MCTVEVRVYFNDKIVKKLSCPALKNELSYSYYIEGFVIKVPKKTTLKCTVKTYEYEATIQEEYDFYNGGEFTMGTQIGEIKVNVS